MAKAGSSASGGADVGEAKKSAERTARIEKRSDKDKNQGKKTGDSGVELASLNSEVTVYRAVVTLDIAGDDKILTVVKTVEPQKRFSNSSDDQLDTSDETDCRVQLNSSDEEQQLFQKFLDCKLKEYREGQRQKDEISEHKRQR